MSISTPQVESRIQFSPLPQEVEQGHNQIQVNNERHHTVLEPYEERFDWDALVIMLRLAMVGMLLVGLLLRRRELYEPTTLDPVAPKFFLQRQQRKAGSENKLRGKRNAGCDQSHYAPIHVAKPSFVVGRGRDKEGAFEVEYDGVGGEPTHCGRQCRSGHCRRCAMGEVGLGDGFVATFAMYPKCSNLAVKFVAEEDQLNMIDRKPRECVGLIQWGPVKDSI